MIIYFIYISTWKTLAHYKDKLITTSSVYSFDEVFFCIIKQIEIMFHIVQFPPFTNINRIMVKIIDLCIFHRKDKWRMCRY